MSSTLPTETDTAASYRLMRQTARSMDDVSAWYTSNQHVLEPLPPHAPGTLNIIVSYGIAALNQMLNGIHPEDGLKARLTLSVKASRLDNMLYPAEYALEPFSFHGEHAYQTSFQMKFAEWPLAVADLAFDYINNAEYKPPYRPEWALRAESILWKYLPQHFPGISLEWLKTVSHLELLTRSEQTETPKGSLGFNRDEFVAVLFATHRKDNTVQFPTDMTIPMG